VPGTVVIAQGGTVTFSTFGVHQVAIYSPGTEPGDIDTTITSAPPAFCPAVPLIADPNNLVATYTHPCNSGPVDLSHTFTDPGRYLVICSFTPHFEGGMYGWVIVR
jgi:plastocyanin